MGQPLFTHKYIPTITWWYFIMMDCIHKICFVLDCLQRFVDVEELADTERYMCPKCNKRQPSTKKFWLTSLSNVCFRCFSNLLFFIHWSSYFSIFNFALYAIIQFIFCIYLQRKIFQGNFCHLKVLCLHLKRFRYSQFGRSKVDTYVKFPLQDLNMNQFLLRQSQVLTPLFSLFCSLSFIKKTHSLLSLS